LSDLDKIIQLDPLNSSAYYLKCFTYYTKNDNNNAKISFKKYEELLLNSDNILAKIQLFYLEYLLNKNSSKDLDDILAKIDKYYNIYEDKFLQFIRCKIYIELKKYNEARSLLKHIGIEFIDYFMEEHPDFLSCNQVYTDYVESELTKLGIDHVFSRYMYINHGVYFVSNLTNLYPELYRIREGDKSSLSGPVLSSKDENLYLFLPKLKVRNNNQLICKMNVKKILSKDCFIKFTPNGFFYRDVHMLRHKNVSNLEGLGWIEYRTPIRSPLHYDDKLSIEIVTNSVEMQIEYVRFGEFNYNRDKITYIHNISLMGYLLPHYRKFFSNVPETFKDKYLSRKEMENLLDLKVILNSL
ncbi:hypothetical protein RhiirB3_455984, partial [Rhizophagus irregularis]